MIWRVFMRKFTFAIIFIVILLPWFIGDAEMGVKRPASQNIMQLNKRIRNLERTIESLKNRTISTKSKLETQDEFALSHSTSEITQVQKDAQLQMNEKGAMQLYDTSMPGERIDVALPSTGKVYETQAGITVPSSYYLDLRVTTPTDITKNIMADWLTLHDNSTPQETIGLTNINISNTITVTGPIANGRDQVNAFPNSTWIYFFAIYNPSTKIVASLSSLSQTAPTLPAGYTFWVYLNACYRTAPGALAKSIQINDRVWLQNSVGFIDTAPANADTYQAYSFTIAPPSAKSIFGHFGLSSSPSAARGMAVASNSLGRHDVYGTFPNGAHVGTYYIVNPCYFHIPILISQTIYWMGSSTESVYSILINGWIDDL